MSTLGDSLWQQYGGDVPSTPERLAADAIARYGSGRAAARALGVDEKTIRRWKTGQTRHSDNVDRLARESRRDRAQERSGPLEAKFRYSGRDRKLEVGGGGRQTFKPGAVDRINAAYERGDRDAMAAEFVGGVTDPFYRRKLGEALALDGVEPADAGEGSSSPAVFVS